MAYIMTTELEIQQKSGANVNTAFDTTAMTASAIRAESMINCLCRKNYSDLITTGMNADVAGIFSDIVSSFVAIEAISYDMDALGRSTAESMITVLRDGMLRNLQIIRDIKVQTFITGAGGP